MAITADSEVLLIGAAKIYVAPASPTLVLPTHADIAALAAGTFLGFTYVGDTEDVTQLVEKPTFVSAKTKNQSRPVDAAVSESETKLTTKLRNVSLNKIADLIGGTVSGNTITSGGVGPVAKFAVALVGPASDTVTVLFTAARAYFSNGLDISFTNDFAGIAVELTVLHNPAGADYTIDVE